MITLQDLLRYLKNSFCFYSGPDPSYNGLQVEGKSTIHKIGFAVSASVEVLEIASERGCDAVIVHHGIFWEKDSPLVIGPKKKKLELLLENKISLFAYHLPLDAHELIGNNWKAANDLGLQNLKPFGKIGNNFIGVKGEIAEMAIDPFIEKLETYYRHTAFVSKAAKFKVRKVAIVSGGAHKMITEAAEQGMDCFITGSFDEPVWDLAKELDVHFVALGHHATERVGILALMDEISKNLEIESTYIDVQNPF